MSEIEKTSLTNIINKISQLNESDRRYLFGVMDGMAIASANAGTGQTEEAS